MGYLHIANLYRPEAQGIFALGEVYALEKIHGTSTHIAFDPNQPGLRFFSGGEKHESFVKLFDETSLRAAFSTDTPVIVYGEAFGGKCQGMRDTYGSDLRFIAFDVKIGDNWLTVPEAEQFCRTLGLPFVVYARGPSTLEFLNAQRDADSNAAVVPGKKREGIVIRPLTERVDEHGERVIAKHKRDDFCETKTPRLPQSEEKRQVMLEATSIANEYVTEMRLAHVLDKIPNEVRMSNEIFRTLIAAMQEDISREAAGEFVPSPAALRAIATRTALLYKQHLQKL